MQDSTFAACAACSASLWYNGWGNHLNARLAALAQRDAPGPAPAGGRRVYLSLGQAEEKARNPRMAAVGSATRATASALAESGLFDEALLAWHPGGHFSNVPARLAQGLAFLVKP